MTHIEKMRLQAALKELRGKSILAALCDGHSDAMCTWQERAGQRQTRSEAAWPLGVGVAEVLQRGGGCRACAKC